MSVTDSTPRFTEADLRKAHRAGFLRAVGILGPKLQPIPRKGFDILYGGRPKKPDVPKYSASLWDHDPLRAELGLGPKAK